MSVSQILIRLSRNAFVSRSRFLSINARELDLSKFDGLKSFLPEDLDMLPNKRIDDGTVDKKEQEKDKDDSFDFGRAWSVKDLQVLNSATLHRLWFVLLKQRNALLSADAFYRQGQRAITQIHIVKQLRAVQEGLENIKSVIEEREEAIDSAKTHLWLKRITKIFGKEYAAELAKTYIQYTFPHTDKEQEEIIEFKHYQLFDRHFNRIHQPYEKWELKLYNKNYWRNLQNKETLTAAERFTEKRKRLWERKVRNYEGDDYRHEMDFFPVSEGFLHDIKREDWEDMLLDPDDMIESRERREFDRLKIVKKIWAKDIEGDVEKSVQYQEEWDRFIYGPPDAEEGDDKITDS